MLLDKLLFKPKHWQMFTITLTLVLVNSWFFDVHPRTVATLGDVLPGTVILVWYMLLGSRLKKHLPTYYTTHYFIFIVSGLAMIIGLLASVLYREELEQASLQVFNTWKAFLIFIPFLIIIFAFIGFIARAMKSLQTNDRATVSDYAGDVFLWGVWWIGVWFLQPRLNRLYDRFHSQS